MNKRVLISGASRGLGLCFAKKYLEDGCMVFAGARNEGAAGLKELKEKYGDLLVSLQLDVADTKSVESAAEAASAYTDHLDVIINNAGIHSETSFLELEDADLDDCLPVYDVNAVGPIRVVKAFLPLLKKGESGLVVNISSESGSIGTAERIKEFDYCMSKAALNMGTKLLHNYLKDMNINVIAVHPGWMRTDMGGQNATQDPFETAGRLTELFEEVREGRNKAVFMDNTGAEYPW